MSKRIAFDLAGAESARYSKIQNVINILNNDVDGTTLSIVFNDLIASADLQPFCVGKAISIDGQTINIGKKSYPAYEIQKVTINTEGSMAVYDRFGKKICGCLRLNVSLKNIELFCVWVRKYHIPAEIRSGKAERFFQYALLGITVLLCLLYKLTRGLR